MSGRQQYLVSIATIHATGLHRRIVVLVLRRKERLNWHLVPLRYLLAQMGNHLDCGVEKMQKALTFSARSCID